MTRLVRGLAVLSLCGILPSRLAAEGPRDEDLMQGRWQATEVISSGTPLPAEHLKSFRVEFAGKQFTMSGYTGRGDQKPAQFNFTLDATASPKQIDVFPPNAEQAIPCIYQLEGDTLSLCLSRDAQQARPAEFAAPAQSGLSLLKLKRVESAPAGGLIHELPADGSWVQFAIVGESKNADDRWTPGLSGTVTIRSVGRDTIDGESCRWIEIDSAVEIQNTGKPATRNHEIMKFLIPEKRLVGGDNPCEHVLKGKLKNATGTRDLDVQGADARLVASLDEFFHSPLPEREKSERVTLETAAGKFSCRYVEAREPGSPGRAPETFTRTWSTYSIPFGVARYRHTRSLGTTGSRALELTVTKFGDDAKSAIAD